MWLIINISRKYDVITLWHSLEHIHNINKIFRCVNKYLYKSGILVIAVPNIQAPERKRLGGNWAPYDVPRHLYHFDPDSLKRLCRKYNFKIYDQMHFHSLQIWIL